MTSQQRTSIEKGLFISTALGVVCIMMLILYITDIVRAVMWENQMLFTCAVGSVVLITAIGFLSKYIIQIFQSLLDEEGKQHD